MTVLILSSQVSFFCKYLITFIYYLCLGDGEVHMYHAWHMCGSQGLNAGCQTWQQMAFTANANLHCSEEACYCHPSLPVSAGAL